MEKRPGQLLGYGLDYRGYITVQTGSGLHPSSYPMGIAGTFFGTKAAGART